MAQSSVRIALLGALMALGACAHVGIKAPDDPVEEAHQRLVAVSGASGEVVCAAERVEADLFLAALRHNKVGQPVAGNPNARRRASQARNMNLSQGSGQMSQALEAGKAAAASRRAGVPGAQLMGLRAMSEFDASYGAVTGRSVSALGGRSARKIGPSGAEEAEQSWALSQYSTVWTGYFLAGSDDRDQLLDWLTSRSMEHLGILRTYQERFGAALEDACGG